MLGVLHQAIIAARPAGFSFRLLWAYNDTHVSIRVKNTV